MERRFTVRFWGVRGTIPTPGPGTVRYGGNTPCIEVRCGNRLIILDSGSGIRELGVKLLKEMPVDMIIFLSHLHWDHIQGFPVFGPCFYSGNKIEIYGEKKMNDSLENIMAGQMNYPHFPVPLSEIKAELEFHELVAGDTVDLGGIVVKTSANNHPDGCLSYRLECQGKSFVYATDTEHYPDKIDPVLLKQAESADYLVYDATYTDDEYKGIKGPPRMGWGHSTWQEGVKLAKAAGVKQLILFHHDPSHDDDFLAEVERQARREFPNCLEAYEGLEIDIVK